ncbi:MAG: tRNA lysidine(34) synthetase TilS [Cyanobacteriota bacterium]|nr:tRNA lysidine(34) synthetase TilS [Cyanobacteriota bacterium]
MSQPALLPQGSALLLAVSGGQDSMALLGLLLGLQRLHGWRLVLWHGDHGWRDDSPQQAAELARWCKQKGLTLLRDAQPRSDGDSNGSSGNREAQAREWRYQHLERRAREQGCSTVVTGHTGSDRAETLLLHLARGSHRRGLASLRPQRLLAAEVMLSRPLLLFSRSETGQICRDLALPIWLDTSNEDTDFSRNRLRLEVLPVLEALHPGATRRLAGTAERLRLELDAVQEWHQIAVQWLSCGGSGAMDRQRLNQLQPINRAAVLNHWLGSTTGRTLGSRQIEALVSRLDCRRPPGQAELEGGWQLRWDRSRLTLVAPPEPGP